MIISIKTAHGYLSWQPPTATGQARLQYRPTVGEWEQFDVQGLEALAPLIAALLGHVEPVDPVKPPDPPQPPDVLLPPREQFLAWVTGKPFGQQTLLELEPTLQAHGWLLTPPNAVGERTKIHPPGGPWTRVGFGEGQWVWLEQKDQ